MASVYDMIQQKNGTVRYRLNKVFISPDKIPEEIKSIMTLDNIVDENGMILVDQKNEASKVAEEEDTTDTLQRIDGPAEEETPADEPDTTGADAEAASVEPADQAAPAVDDSANEGADDADEDEEGDIEKMLDAVEKTDTTAPETVTEAAPEVKKQKATARVRKIASDPVETFKSKVPQSHPGMGFPRVNGKTVDLFDGVTPHTKVKLVGGQMVPLSEESFKTKTEGQIIARLKELGMTILDFTEIEQASESTGSSAGNLLMEDQEIDEDIQLG